MARRSDRWCSERWANIIYWRYRKHGNVYEKNHNLRRWIWLSNWTSVSACITAKRCNFRFTLYWYNWRDMRYKNSLWSWHSKGLSILIQIRHKCNSLFKQRGRNPSLWFTRLRQFERMEFFRWTWTNWSLWITTKNRRKEIRTKQ